MDYLVHLAIFAAIYAFLVITLNLVLGYTGLLSVTHAAFDAIGAYTVAILTTRFDVNFFLAMLLGILFSCVAAAAIGLVLSKFKDDYYALASIGFVVIVYGVLLNWHSLTRGPLGITGIDRPTIGGFEFTSNYAFLGLCLALLAMVYLICRFIVNSSFGRVLKAIREDEQAVQVFGYKTQHYKLLIFVISAGLASITGGLYASYISFIDPTGYTLLASIFIMSAVIMGGLASLKGSLWGAMILMTLPEILRFIGFPDSVAAQMRQLVFGLALVLLMLYRPQGLMGEYKL